MSATAAATERVGRVSGTRVAYDLLLHGLRTDGPLVQGATGTDIARFTFNRRTAFLLTHPDLVDHVLFESVERYHKSIEYELLRAALGLSLFTDEDESWRKHRMLLNPVLAKRHLESLFELMVEPVESFVDKLDDGSDRIALEMSDGMTELTLDVVGSALFGRGMADLARRIGRNVTFGLRAAERATRLILLFNPPALLARAVALAVRHVPLWPPPISGLHNVLATVDETVWGVIHERQRHPGRDDDLLGQLLSVRDEEGNRLPLKRVRDEACTFMLAGHETTANALSWMWYLLALNHDARERMLAEVDEVLGGRRPTFADVERLPWTQACFLEAMRVFPPAWIIPRQCVKDDVIAGHRIRKGDSVLIPIHALHHDERFVAGARGVRPDPLPSGERPRASPLLVPAVRRRAARVRRQGVRRDRGDRRDRDDEPALHLRVGARLSGRAGGDADPAPAARDADDRPPPRGGRCQQAVAA